VLGSPHHSPRFLVRVPRIVTAGRLDGGLSFLAPCRLKTLLPFLPFQIRLCVTRTGTVQAVGSYLARNQNKGPVAVIAFPVFSVPFHCEGALPPHRAQKAVRDAVELEALWRNPQRYTDLFLKHEVAAVVECDFSLWCDDPVVVQAYNVYRTRWLGSFWQEHGLNVIPSLNWSDERVLRAVEAGKIEPAYTTKVHGDLRWLNSIPLPIRKSYGLPRVDEKGLVKSLGADEDDVATTKDEISERLLQAVNDGRLEARVLGAFATRPDETLQMISEDIAKSYGVPRPVRRDTRTQEPPRGCPGSCGSCG
jgi:hypothetical protein